MEACLSRRRSSAARMASGCQLAALPPRSGGSASAPRPSHACGRFVYVSKARVRAIGQRQLAACGQMQQLELRLHSARSTPQINSFFMRIPAHSWQSLGWGSERTTRQTTDCRKTMYRPDQAASHPGASVRHSAHVADSAMCALERSAFASGASKRSPWTRPVAESCPG